MGYHSAGEANPTWFSGPLGAGWHQNQDAPYADQNAGPSRYGDPAPMRPPEGMNGYNAASTSPPGSMGQQGLPVMFPGPGSSSHGHGHGAGSGSGAYGQLEFGGLGSGPLPNTPLLANGGAPASPPNIHRPIGNGARGYEYDYSNVVPPSAAADNTPGSPIVGHGQFDFNVNGKRISSPLPSLPAGAAAPSYNPLITAAGVGSATAGGYVGTRSRRKSGTPSFGTTASRYSVDDTPLPESAQSPMSIVPESSLGHTLGGRSGSSGGHSGPGPVTPGYDGYDQHGVLDGDPSYFIRTESSGGNGAFWANGRPRTPVIDQRLDPDSVLGAKGRGPSAGKRLSSGALVVGGYGSGGSAEGMASQSEESLGAGSFLRDNEDYSRRVLQVKNST
ncbi:hypothetical protein FRB94_006253 [Tulasnella sp. JGI-2019a]|nr:hypothetical protein FRB94_006253 [Tulasnella sp. JGI-2019a]